VLLTDQAWEVIRDATSTDTMALRGKMTDLTRARKSAMPAWLQIFPGKNLKAAAATIEEARVDPQSQWKNAAETWNALRPIGEELFTVNKVSPEDARPSGSPAKRRSRRGNQARTASMMLANVRVGTTRVKRNPALSRRSRYSSWLRSCPPGISSIARSRIFAGSGSWPGRTTASTISRRPAGCIARRQFARIRTQLGSSQLWMQWDTM
jgi:hypothetical protein